MDRQMVWRANFWLVAFDLSPLSICRSTASKDPTKAKREFPILAKWREFVRQGIAWVAGDPSPKFVASI